SIDNKEYTITEAYVRSKLQLADATRIANFPNADIYVGLATGYLAPTLTKKIFGNMKRGYARDHVPLLPAMLAGALPDQGLDSGNINESPLRSHDTPLHDVNMSGCVEDNLELKELSLLVPKLELKIGSLEKELKETKQTFGNAILTLVDRVKSLNCLKINQRDFVTPTKTKFSASVEAQEEDISPTTLEAAKTLSKVASQKARLTDKGRRYKRRKMSKEVNTGSTKFNTGSIPISTPSIVQKVKVIVPSPDKEAMRLQAQMDEEVAKQVHLDEMVAKRVQVEGELSNQQAQRMAQSLQGESKIDDDFAKRMVEMINQKKKYYAKQKAKLVKSIESFVPMGSEERVKRQEEKGDEPMKKKGKRKKQIVRKGKHIDKTAHDEIEEEKEAFMKDKVSCASSKSDIGIDVIPTATKPPSIVAWKIIPQSGLKCVYQIIRRDGSDKIYMSFGAILKEFSRDDLTELYRLVIKKYEANKPAEMYDRLLWGDLKTMFDPPLIHCLTLDASTIYMLVDRKYPLSKDACQAMLNMKLLDGSKDEMCNQLLKMIEKQARIR
ncbi:hypothetical protein Tco_0077368, partial [Tanacetum coccineum]